MAGSDTEQTVVQRPRVGAGRASAAEGGEESEAETGAESEIETETGVRPRAETSGTETRAVMSPSQSLSQGGAPLTPEQVLERDEALRFRMFVAFVLVLVTMVAAVVLVIGGDPLAQRVHLVGLSVAALGSLWMAWILRDPASYRTAHNVAFGLLSVGAVTTAYYYWGVLSAAMLVVPFGAFIFSMGQSLAGALVIIAAALGTHLVLTLLTITGAIADRGIFRAHEGVAAQIAALVLVQFICVATFAMARRSRQTALQSIEELDRATRAIAQRDALLAEARQDLDRALQIGGPGRYTGQSLGRFRVGVVLGRGAMGEVYEAIQEPDGERCAIKLLHPQVASKPAMYRRFVRETRAAASLRAPNVVRVLEVGGEDAPLPYLAMERLDGVDLAGVLKRTPRLPEAEVVELCRQVGAGLAAARAAGIVHRDLKPQNIFRTEEAGRPVWKILDFGVSKLADSTDTLTKGNIVGTPAYMAPEQARGGAVDHRADLYALGVITYRALTGRPAFTGEDIPQLLYAVVHRMPPRPSSIVSLSDDADLVLAIALAKKPADRFEDGAELAHYLELGLRQELPSAVRARAQALLARLDWGRVARAPSRA
jgi:eukaryotic-like serine/threonine-protein kinase